MARLRIRQGGVTLDVADLEQDVRARFTSALRGALAILEPPLDAVAATARSRWYSMVRRRTGRSGQIEAVTLLDQDRGSVSVRVQSVDERKDGKGRPVAVFVHAPFADAMISVQVSREEWMATDRRFRERFPFVKRRDPMASTGERLSEVLIRKPATEVMERLQGDLALGFVRGFGR